MVAFFAVGGAVAVPVANVLCRRGQCVAGEGVAPPLCAGGDQATVAEPEPAMTFLIQRRGWWLGGVRNHRLRRRVGALLP